MRCRYLQRWAFASVVEEHGELPRSRHSGKIAILHARTATRFLDPGRSIEVGESLLKTQVPYTKCKLCACVGLSDRRRDAKPRRRLCGTVSMTPRTRPLRRGQSARYPGIAQMPSSLKPKYILFHVGAMTIWWIAAVGGMSQTNLMVLAKSSACSIFPCLPRTGVQPAF